MARPVSITKDRILAAALDIVRSGGSGSLTARSLSAALGCGANALFNSFGSIQGILLGISPASVTKARQRLKAKLQ